MFFKKKFGTGALKDKPDMRDYDLREIASAPIVSWTEKTDFRSFPIFNQDGSSSCVAQATAKILGIENYLEEGKFVSLSARDIYTRRSNFGLEGMYFRDAMEIGNKYGAAIEQLMPSQQLDEVYMNLSNDRTFTTEYTAKIFKGGSFVSIPRDIESIASILSKGKGVLLGFSFDMNEWNREYPELATVSSMTYSHGVAAIDFGLIKGKKYIVIEDSWGETVGKKGQRFLSEEWISSRCNASWYFEDLANKEAVEIIEKYQFLNDLELGMKNEEVKKLQEILQQMGFFPAGQECTGFYYGITRQAVLDFQLKYGIVQSKEESGAGRFGPKTREKLNSLQ